MLGLTDVAVYEDVVNKNNMEHKLAISFYQRFS